MNKAQSQSPDTGARKAPAGDVAAEDRDRIAAALDDLVRDMNEQGTGRGDPMREIFARLGDRWSVLLLLLLRIARLRHAALRRMAGAVSAEGAISQRMLTLRLRALERDGLIIRHVEPTVPPRVDYEITPLGLGLLGRMDGLMQWVRENNGAIRLSREAFDAAEDGRRF